MSDNPPKKKPSNKESAAKVEANKKTSDAKAKAANDAMTKRLKAAEVDLSTFKKKDVIKWSKKGTGGGKATSTKQTAYGGSVLGKGTRIQRKKNNKSSR
jgi:hypothetical protein